MKKSNEEEGTSLDVWLIYCKVIETLSERLTLVSHCKILGSSSSFYGWNKKIKY